MFRKQYYHLIKQYCELISEKGFNYDFLERKKLNVIKERLLKFLLLQSCFLRCDEEEKIERNERLLDKIIIEEQLERTDYEGTYHVKTLIKAGGFMIALLFLIMMFTFIISILLMYKI